MPDQREPGGPGARIRPEAADPAGIIATMTGFAGELRSAGVAVGTGDLQTFCAALRGLDPTDLLDLYWAGHATLIARREQEKGQVVYRFDIHLQGPDETVFFDV